MAKVRQVWVPILRMGSLLALMTRFFHNIDNIAILALPTCPRMGPDPGHDAFPFIRWAPLFLKALDIPMERFQQPLDDVLAIRQQESKQSLQEYQSAGTFFVDCCI